MVGPNILRVSLLILAVVSAQGCYKVGFSTSSVTYRTATGSERTMAVALWYPSAGVETIAQYPYLAGNAIINGPVTPTPRPLVVLSHGVWECGVVSAHLAHSLASAGYIVAAPDHEDAAVCRIGGGTNPIQPVDWTKPLWESFPNRPSDVVAVIDHMLDLSSTPGPFSGTIDKVAVAGHSVGGWTVAAISGGYPGLRDPRVEAALLWSPSTTEAPAFYEAVEPPVLYQFGELEGLWKAQVYGYATAPKYLDMVPRADHYAFTDRACRAAGFYTVQSCLSFSGTARAITGVSVNILNHHVMGDAWAGQVLPFMVDAYQR